MSLAQRVAVLKGKDFWTGPRRFFDQRDRGRPAGRLPGGYIADLADLRKGIILCRYCVPKFCSPKVGYVAKKNLPFVMGNCDGCNNFGTRQHFLVHHTFANLLG